MGADPHPRGDGRPDPAFASSTQQLASCLRLDLRVGCGRWTVGTGLCVGTLVESELGRAATLFRLARAWVLDVSDSDGEIVAQTFGERGLR